MSSHVNPIVFRIAYNKTWSSNWVSMKKYSQLLTTDFRIREYLSKATQGFGVEDIQVSLGNNSAQITVVTSKMGLLIGKGGDMIRKLESELAKVALMPVKIAGKESKRPNLSARILAESVGEQITKRISAKRAMKFAINQAMESGALGCRIEISGRVGGSEKSKKEKDIAGKIPLQTLSADIDYCYHPIRTLTGINSIKVWVFRGEKRKSEVNKHARA